MKNLVKLVSIAALLSTSAFADGSGPSNKVSVESDNKFVQSAIESTRELTKSNNDDFSMEIYAYTGSGRIEGRPSVMISAQSYSGNSVCTFNYKKSILGQAVLKKVQCR